MGAYETEKEKVLMILQSILTAILLIFIIIDVGMGMNKGWMLKTELGIVIVLFVLNALKAYPERKKAIVFLCAAYLGGGGLFYTQFI